MECCDCCLVNSISHQQSLFILIKKNCFRNIYLKLNCKFIWNFASDDQFTSNEYK